MNIYERAAPLDHNLLAVFQLRFFYSGIYFKNDPSTVLDTFFSTSLMKKKEREKRLDFFPQPLFLLRLN